MSGMWLASYLVLLFAFRNNAQYLQNVFVIVYGDRSASLYEIIRGDMSEGTGLSCFSLQNTTFHIENNNAKKDCSDDFFIFMGAERAVAIAVTHEPRVKSINITDLSGLLLLSPTGRTKLEFLQGEENVESICAGSAHHGIPIYTVNPLKIPDTYVLFGSLITILANSSRVHFTISISTDILNEHFLSPGSFVVVGTRLYPDAHNFNGQDNRVVFKMNTSVQVDIFTNYDFDSQLSGGVEIITGGLWFNGSRVLSLPLDTDASDNFSYYGDGLELRYLTIVPSSLQQNWYPEYFTTEVRVRELPPDVTPPPAPLQETTGQPDNPTVTTNDTPYPKAPSLASELPDVRTEFPVYTGETPAATTAGTRAPPLTTRPGPTGFPAEDGKYCACRYDHLWLDVVFLVEATDSMGKDGIDDVISFMQGALYQMSKGDRRFSTRAGIIAYGANARVIARFSDLLTDDNVDDISIPFLGGKETNIESAMRQANDLLSVASGSRRARKVIVLVATAFRAGSYEDPHQIAEGFRESGGTIITIDYIEKDGIVDPKLTSLATHTFAYNNTNGVYTFGDDDLLKAFCDINCFCSTNQRSFEMPELASRPGLPTGGCYEIVTLAAVERAARIDCRRKNASLPSIHTEHKQRYLTSLFPPKTQHWIGLERDGASFAWIDYTPYDYSNWPKDADIGTGQAFYSWQYSGFRTGWFSAPSTMSAQYTCQFAPCDSINDACLVVVP